MSKRKLPRLLAAAKEFNLGQDTLVDFLLGKGFPKEDLRPTSKLTDDMYDALLQEYRGIKVLRGQRILGSKMEQGAKNLEISIDPGTAPKEEIASLLAEISILFREMGGSGIEFRLDHVTLKQGEVI